MADAWHCYRCGTRLDGLDDEPEHNGMRFCSVVCMEQYFDAVDAAMAVKGEVPCQNSDAHTGSRFIRACRALRRAWRRRSAVFKKRRQPRPRR